MVAIVKQTGRIRSETASSELEGQSPSNTEQVFFFGTVVGFLQTWVGEELKINLFEECPADVNRWLLSLRT